MRGKRTQRDARGRWALARRPWWVPDASSERSASLQEGWVIANHILVSFHVAFISSVLALPAASVFKAEVLRFIFLSPETLVSALFMFVSWHSGIALHEMGHFLRAARLNALNDNVLGGVKEALARPPRQRFLYHLRLFLLAPYGKAPGIKKEGLNYYPDAPYNLAVAAAGPDMSRRVAATLLPPAILLLALGLAAPAPFAVYAGRLLLGIGVVGLLDFLIADPGKYREFRERERRAQDAAAQIERTSTWYEAAPAAKQKLLSSHMQEAVHPRLGPVTAPWQFRNCGMGGRHTEKEYPESNISMQEAMFLILGASDAQEAQEMTVRLQNRLKEIIEKEEGCRVMGIGLEGGLAPYVDRADYPLPELRLWAMMKRTIEECGYRPGVDVAIALDPAMSELENAYRDEFDMPDAIGMYLFWRDKAKNVLDRDGVLDIYKRAIFDYDIPILSIEDGFSERDPEGWQNLLRELGDRVLVIGDDLVTTNDRTIEEAAAGKLINTALIKANQIGTLLETLLAMLVGLGKGFDLVVSHRSKSPNDDMEAHIALAANALGLKCGGGANTERLVKYQAVASLMLRAGEDASEHALKAGQRALVDGIIAYEEPTNAGIPTVGAELEVALPSAGVHLTFKGATPLGTSAGEGEAIHLVDSVIEYADHREVIDAHPALFVESEPRVHIFKKGTTPAAVRKLADPALAALFARVQRYQGKGCMSAAHNVHTSIAPYFASRDLARRALSANDRALLRLEARLARQRQKLAEGASAAELARVKQRKQNLGMNAVLSVSLALARAVAHVQGKQLYELLREEMLAIIEKLAREHGVEIQGSMLPDYVAALREVNGILTARGEPLYEALRRVTAVYADDEDEPEPDRPAPDEPERSLEATAEPEKDAATADVFSQPMGAQARRSAVVEESAPAERGESAPAEVGESAVATAPASTPAPARPKPVTTAPTVPRKRLGTPATHPFLDSEQAAVRALSQTLYRAYVEVRPALATDALRAYLDLRDRIAARAGQFGIVSNRVFTGRDFLIVPYMVGDVLVVCAVQGGEVERELARAFPPGTILTDQIILELAGRQADAVDLERDFFELDPQRVEDIRLARIADIADLLGRVNQCTNINEAVYYLRFLVARLTRLTVKEILSAKNLKPEVKQVVDELVRLLNGPLARQPRFLLRILVRNIPLLLFKPNLIDRVWNDTIDLSEVHVRGSSIATEIRRSAHHALGKRTLDLTAAYLDYLRNGQVEGLGRLGYGEALSPADAEARQREAAVNLVARLVDDLERLLGATEVVARIREWQTEYTATLVRCDMGKSLDEELETLVAGGIQGRNGWVYRHHLRIIARKLEGFELPADRSTAFAARLRELQALDPGAADFDADGTAAKTRAFVREVTATLREFHQDDVFGSLDTILEHGTQADPFQVFSRVCKLRRRLFERIGRPGFPEHRYYLLQLDCLLEELGYLAVRRVATTFEEHGVLIERCLEVIRLCTVNLGYSGLDSRELADLAGMLSHPGTTFGELDNILHNLKRVYHKVLRRATIAYEKMMGTLELDQEELRAVLANMARYLHDLNTLAHFSDIATTYVETQVSERAALVWSPGSVAEIAEGHEILHLSHRDDIRARVEEPTTGAVSLRDAYGAKGSGLVYISYLHIPTRDGFLLPTSIPRSALHLSDPERLRERVDAHLEILERDIQTREGGAKRFADPAQPLLLAVRGGSVFSMPGILSTVVFVGLNDEIVEGLAAIDPWLAYDSYRRFLASYAEAVWGIDFEQFDVIDDAKRRYGVSRKTELSPDAMREVVEATKTILAREGRRDALEHLLANPREQLYGAVGAVFESWNSERARNYRDLKGLCHTWQTGAIVQEMAFGNRPNQPTGPGFDETTASLTGAVPRTVMSAHGVRHMVGEFKFSAAGDDLVSGVTGAGSFQTIDELRALMPMLHRRLDHVVVKLRRFMGTDQEVEFTVDQGVLSVLQTRSAETGVDEASYAFVAPGTPATRGIGIRGGGFRGVAAFDGDDLEELAAREWSEQVDGVLLVLENPTPDDIPMIISAGAVLTARGGSTSHAAVAVHGVEDKRCFAVMSAANLNVDADAHEAIIVGPGGAVEHRIRKGDVVSIHGTTGEVYVGARQLATPEAVPVAGAAP